MDGDDWDLQAVVRGCCFRGKAAKKKAESDPFISLSSSLPTADKREETDAMCFPDLSLTPGGVQELEELCKPYFSKPQQQQSPWQSNPSSPSSSAAPACVAAVRVPRQPHRPVPQIPRSKRRKNQQKKVVCHVPADGVSSDMWAWRKYGQKPIKGSPYPRGYYRCSSSKGCLARKQVERSRTDPEMFIITYTAEHSHPVPTHRNSLAGSTRQKFPSPAASSGEGGVDGGAGDHLPLSSSPLSSSTLAVLSPTTPLTASSMEEEEEEEEGVLLVEDMEVIGEDELLFMGDTSNTSVTSAEAVEAANSAFFDDDGVLHERFFPPPWLAKNNNNNAAAAAGGS